jgi:hypothetical protein
MAIIHFRIALGVFHQHRINDRMAVIKMAHSTFRIMFLD